MRKRALREWQKMQRDVVVGHTHAYAGALSRRESQSHSRPGTHDNLRGALLFYMAPLAALLFCFVLLFCGVMLYSSFTYLLCSALPGRHRKPPPRACFTAFFFIADVRGRNPVSFHPRASHLRPGHEDVPRGVRNNA